VEVTYSEVRLNDNPLTHWGGAYWPPSFERLVAQKVMKLKFFFLNKLFHGNCLSFVVIFRCFLKKAVLYE
jgi:hypothetical protein